MADFNINLGQINIDREQKIILITISITVFVLILTAFVSWSFWGVYREQDRHIDNQREVLGSLKTSHVNVQALDKAFNDFNSGDELIANQLVCRDENHMLKTQNKFDCIIDFDFGGDQGNGNSFLVARALPSEYNRSSIQAGWLNFVTRFKYKATMGVPESPECQEEFKSEADRSAESSGEYQIYCFTLNVEDLSNEKEILHLLKRIDSLISPTSVISLEVVKPSSDSPGDGIEANLQLKGYYRLETDDLAPSDNTLEAQEPQEEEIEGEESE